MRYFILAFMLASPVFAQESNWNEQQQLEQMRVDQEQTQEAQQLHQEFSQPSYQQQPDVRYVPYDDPNPPPNVYGR